MGYIDGQVDKGEVSEAGCNIPVENTEQDALVAVLRK